MKEYKQLKQNLEDLIHREGMAIAALALQGSPRWAIQARIDLMDAAYDMLEVLDLTTGEADE